MDGLLRRGRQALAEADWQGARDCFEQARELDEPAEVLDGLGAAAHFQGEHLEAIELKERAFAAYRRRGKRTEAAEVASWLAFLYGAVHGNRAAANGWIEIAQARIAHWAGQRAAFDLSAPEPGLVRGDKDGGS